jgi:hypothetical protein
MKWVGVIFQQGAVERRKGVQDRKGSFPVGVQGRGLGVHGKDQLAPVAGLFGRRAGLGDRLGRGGRTPRPEAQGRRSRADQEFPPGDTRSRASRCHFPSANALGIAILQAFGQNAVNIG